LKTNPKQIHRQKAQRTLRCFAFCVLKNNGIEKRFNGIEIFLNDIEKLFNSEALLAFGLPGVAPSE